MSQKITATAGFYVDRQSLTYFTTKNSDLPPITLSPEIVQDLHIYSEPALERMIHSWLEHTKVSPGKIILMVSEAITFSLDLNDVNVTESSPEVQSFLDQVPFNDVQSTILHLDSGARIIALNRNFIEPLITVLERVGFVVVCVTTGFVMGLDEQTQFTPEIGQKALASQNVLARYNVLSETEITAKLKEPEPFLSAKIDKRVIGMVVLFLVLLGILGFLLWSQQ